MNRLTFLLLSSATSCFLSAQASAQELEKQNPTSEPISRDEGPPYRCLSGAISSERRICLDAEARLQQLGYETGRIDGILDAQSQNALRSFQFDAGLPVTGMLDEMSIAVLRIN